MAATSIASWIDSRPTTTSGAFTPDWVAERPLSETAQLRANRRIFTISRNEPTVPASSTHRSPRDQHFAMERGNSRLVPTENERSTDRAMGLIAACSSLSSA